MPLDHRPLHVVRQELLALHRAGQVDAAEFLRREQNTAWHVVADAFRLVQCYREDFYHDLLPLRWGYNEFERGGPAGAMRELGRRVVVAEDFNKAFAKRTCIVQSDARIEELTVVAPPDHPILEVKTAEFQAGGNYHISGLGTHPAACLWLPFAKNWEDRQPAIAFYKGAEGSKLFGRAIAYGMQLHQRHQEQPVRQKLRQAVTKPA